MPTVVPLARIEVLPTGRLALTLRDDPRGLAEYIWQAAAEIDWEPAQQRFISPRPELGPPRKHFAHVTAAAREELGYILTPVADTDWVNVAPEEKTAIEGLTTGA